MVVATHTPSGEKEPMKALDKRLASSKREAENLRAWKREVAWWGRAAARAASTRQNEDARRLWAGILKTVAQPGACRSRLEAVNSFLGD